MTSVSVTTAGESEGDMKSKSAKEREKEILVVQDQGFFTHDTGDTYDGFFEAKKRDLSVRMHGPGVYKTCEGDIYEGFWDNDKLVANDKVTITYVDGSVYEGSFKEWSYAGRGSYKYPDQSTLLCEFSENVPMGQLHLRDPNGQSWVGKATPNGFGWVNPVNHYFTLLEPPTRETSKRRVQKAISDRLASKKA